VCPSPSYAKNLSLACDLAVTLEVRNFLWLSWVGWDKFSRESDDTASTDGFGRSTYSSQSSVPGLNETYIMKIRLRGMTLAALMLSASTVAAGEQDSVTYVGDDDVTAATFVGDSSFSSEDAYFAEDASYAMRASSNNAAASVKSASDSVNALGQADQAYLPIAPLYAPPGTELYTPAGTELYAPAETEPLRTVGYDVNSYPSMMPMGQMAGSSSMAYCDRGCDTAGCGHRKRRGGLADLFGCGGHETWARAELLLWFVQDRETPPLVTTAPTGNFPNLPGASIAFGGDIQSDLSAGFRGDYGIYLSDNFGVGARFWIISESSDDYTRQSDGSDLSIGRPFFNTDLGINDALIVALNGAFAGDIHAESSLDMLGAEAYARLGFISGNQFRSELIGGYSYFQIDDTLRVNSTSVNIPSGQIRTFSDRFETENRFHGGQIGLETTVARGRWSARSLTKVHLGNMNQTVTLAGSRTDTLSGPAAAGMLVGLGESGTVERDEFAFVPEMNLKLGYRFRNHVEFSVGYTFMYFDNVALAGDYVDTNIAGGQFQVPFEDNNRLFGFKDRGLWVQGIDLGVAVTF